MIISLTNNSTIKVQYTYKMYTLLHANAFKKKIRRFCGVKGLCDDELASTMPWMNAHLTVIQRLSSTLL